MTTDMQPILCCHDTSFSPSLWLSDVLLLEPEIEQLAVPEPDPLSGLLQFLDVGNGL